LKRIRIAMVALGGLVVSACGNDESVAPSSPCEYAGITALDASGVSIGPEDPDDWCAGVIAAPNPAALLTTIRFTLSREQRVQIWVQGESVGRVRTLLDETLSAGAYAVTWDITSDSGTLVEPGIYCVTVESDELACTGDIEVQAVPPRPADPAAAERPRGMR
jgi:hypothetical protein